ncbi:MAG TPA: hypothetical protein VMY39_06760 [Planctomycetota bacterium]|nr:hypothetical protein [Planctomycetota bacterium]
MEIGRKHRFDVGYAEAVAIQEELRPEVVRTGSLKNVRLIAGADASYAKRAVKMCAAQMCHVTRSPRHKERVPNRDDPR